MGKRFLILLFPFLLLGLVTQLCSQSILSHLAEKSAKELVSRLGSDPLAITATIEFINFSHLSDIQALTFYQLFALQIEKTNRVVYRDLMVHFASGRGRFNLTERHAIRYELHLILIDSPTGLGFGATIRLADDLSLLDYIYLTAQLEPYELFALSQLQQQPMGENTFLKKKDSYRLDGAVFAISQENGAGDAFELFALTPDHLIIWQTPGSDSGSGQRVKLNWPFPKLPSIQNEGRIISFHQGEERFLALGCNFNKNSLIYKKNPQGLTFVMTVPFVALEKIIMGGNDYLIGANYYPGTNRFSPEINFLQLDKALSQGQQPKTSRRTLEPFYDLKFLLDEKDQFKAFFWVDEKYRLAIGGGEFTPILPPTAQPACGANLTCINKQWLITSGIDDLDDSLMIYEVKDGGLRFIGTQNIEGKVYALTPGNIEKRSGVWVLRHVKDKQGGTINWLDFWELAHAEN